LFFTGTEEESTFNICLSDDICSYLNELSLDAKETVVTIVDSGTSRQMTPFADNLLNVTKVTGQVRLGKKGVHLQVSAVGDHPVFGPVLIVPELTLNLISVSAIDVRGGHVDFRGGNSTGYDSNGSILFVAMLNSVTNLYEVSEQLHMFSHICETCHLSKFAKTGSAPPRLRLATSGFTKAQMGSMKAFKHRSATPDETRKYETFEKVGIDYKGPFRTKGYHGETGFCLLFDYGSGWYTAYLVKTKSQTFPSIKDFKTTIVERKGFKSTILQSDGDSVILSEECKNWLDQQQIIQQSSAPYAQFQNGGVERAMQTVCDKVLTVMADYHPPPKYWGFAVLYVCFILNRVMINIHTGIVPYESVYKELPDISIFQQFYAPGVYHVTKKERQTSSWQFKAEPCRMLGFVEGYKNTYALLNIRFGNIVFRRDVVFDESLYT
jgi:hypothetical protein